MFKSSISLLVLVVAVSCHNKSSNDGFTFIGSFNTIGRSASVKCSSYYLSNAIDLHNYPLLGICYAFCSVVSNYDGINERSVTDARTGCHDGWKDGELVDIETPAEHTDIRYLLSTNGITDVIRSTYKELFLVCATRVWTTGQFVTVSNGWFWYNYASNTLTPISNVGIEPWIGGIVPTSGCLSVGGRDFTYGWQASDCETKRRYLCEVSCCG